MSRFRTLLVPTDFSEHADHALELAISIARDSGGTLHLLHAYEIPLGAIPPYGVAIPDAVLEDLRGSAERRVEEAAKRARAAGATVETHVVHAVPSEAIAETASAIGADLVVMGTRGRTGLKHVLLGSVAERTVRSCPCPVLTTKAA